MICGKAVDCVCKCNTKETCRRGTLSFFGEYCRVAAVAVEVPGRRESEFFEAEYKSRAVFPEVFDKAAVFIFLDTAGAVADYSVGIEH